MSPQKLRIAFDIGSGATKVCCAIVTAPSESASASAAPARIDTVLYECERVMLIGQAVKHSSVDGNTIPQDTIMEMCSIINEMIAESYKQMDKYVLGKINESHNHHQSRLSSDDSKKNAELLRSNLLTSERRVGIATAIFRVASNGSEVLKMLAEDPHFRIKCSILTQEEEAVLGYATAIQYVASNELCTDPSSPFYCRFNDEETDENSEESSPTKNKQQQQQQQQQARPFHIISYDSGAASFQLCTSADGEKGEEDKDTKSPNKRSERSGGLSPSSSSSSSSTALRYFNGQWGSTLAHLALMKVVKAQRERQGAASASTSTSAALQPATIEKEIEMMKKAVAEANAAGPTPSAFDYSSYPPPQHELDPNPVGPQGAVAFHEHLLSDLCDPCRHPADETAYFRDLLTLRYRQVGPLRQEVLLLLEKGGDKRARSEKGVRTTANGITTTPTTTTTTGSNQKGLVIVQAFGGYTSAFNMCSKILGNASYIDREALWSEIYTKWCYKTNAEIEVLGFPQPEVLVAKLLLVYSVMVHLGIDGIHFGIAIGNTRALVAMDKYWKDKDETPKDKVVSKSKI